MFLITTITLFASLGFLSVAQDCNNPLLAFFNLPGLPAPQPGTNLPYCAALQATQTCCAPETVAGFQIRVDSLIDYLNNYEAQRDLYIAQLRDRYLVSFQEELAIIEQHTNDLQQIRADNAALADQLETIILNAIEANNATKDVDSSFSSNLQIYQQARLACFDDALAIQTSAWCLACDPNHATLGLNPNNTLAYSDSLCQNISNSCSAYFNDGAVFTPLFAAREQYWNLTAVTNYLLNYTNGTNNTFTIQPDPYAPLLSQNSPTVPQAWVTTGDVAVPANCQNLWEGDGQLATLLGIGFGSQTNATNGVWTPDLTGTGLNFDTLRVDPADYFGVVNSTASGGQT